MSSTRLPGKVLAPVCGAPMILRQIERLERTAMLDRIVVATSTDPSDDVLARTVQAHGIDVHRGSLDDVLDRFAGALEAFGPAEHVVRLTGDCPLADDELIDAVIEMHLEIGADYSANTPTHRTFPKGLDIEVMKAECLRQAAVEAKTPYEREHVTPFLYGNGARFSLSFLSQPDDEGEVRWTVDRPDDLQFVQAVYEALYPKDPAFTAEDVRDFVRSRPDLVMLGGDRRI